MLRMTTLYLYTFTFSKATKAEQNIAGATKREDAKKYVDWFNRGAGAFVLPAVICNLRTCLIIQNL